MVVITMTAQYNPKMLQSKKGVHSGERVFIVGNGPSLADTDTSKLNGALSFGVNKIFLDTRFTPTYWVIQDSNALKQIPDNGYDIVNTKSEVILEHSWHKNKNIEGSYIEFRSESATIGLFACPPLAVEEDGHKWPLDIDVYVLSGNTTLFSCIQLAFYMGCRDFILVGVDHEYKNPPEPNDRDIHHFHPMYNLDGITPKGINHSMGTVNRAFASSRYWIEKRGGSIYNASASTKLGVIEKVDYEELFND